jgi:hypothetical protein
MSDDENLLFTPARLGSALDELGQLAVEAGRVVDIAVYRGSCLMLVSNFRIATADVDAVAADDQAFSIAPFKPWRCVTAGRATG